MMTILIPVKFLIIIPFFACAIVANAQSSASGTDKFCDDLLNTIDKYNYGTGEVKGDLMQDISDDYTAYYKYKGDMEGALVKQICEDVEDFYGPGFDFLYGEADTKENLASKMSELKQKLDACLSEKTRYRPTEFGYEYDFKPEYKQNTTMPSVYLEITRDWDSGKYQLWLDVAMPE